MKGIWIRYTSMWTKTEKISRFDTDKEALWFKDQVKGEILPWGDGQELLQKGTQRDG